jgi:hypothetical protein
VIKLIRDRWPGGAIRDEHYEFIGLPVWDFWVAAILIIGLGLLARPFIWELALPFLIVFQLL